MQARVCFLLSLIQSLFVENIENPKNLMYNNNLTAAKLQRRFCAVILRKGVRLMIQLDNVKAAFPEIKATLREVGDSL